MNAIQQYHFEPEGTLKILTPKSNYYPRQSRERAHVTSDHLCLLLAAFESGFRCSSNGGPPVIWIISLYLDDIKHIS